jgi:GntR family transcriptional repressor for pyruvate dehydrogenase complex
MLCGYTSSQVFEVRMLIATSVAGLAAERATKSDLTELAEQVAELFASVGDPSNFNVHEERFYRTIARAARNPILSALLENINANLCSDKPDMIGCSRHLGESAELNHEIFRAIRLHRPSEAMLLMERQVKSASVE